jgi:hypothetical protein
MIIVALAGAGTLDGQWVTVAAACEAVVATYVGFESKNKELYAKQEQ